MASDARAMTVSTSDLETLARSLVQAQPSSLGTEITTQVVYPSGELVTVVVAREGEAFFVNDASFGLMYLSKLGVKLTSQQTSRVREAIKHYSCDLQDGRVFRRCDLDQIAESIALVANASRAVADYGVEARRQMDGDFRLSVIERLREVVGPRMRERKSVEGASGRSYRVGGVVLDRSETRPLAFVEAFSGRGTVGDRFAEFFDLRGRHMSVSMMAVYDDSQKWPGSDIKLLAEVCKVVRYSDSRSNFEAIAAQ